MPIYEYRCRKCDREFEVIQKVADGPLRKCRECSGPLEKLVSRSSFQLKGSGWYVTDYARKPAASSDKPKPKAEKSAPAKSEGGSSGSGEGGSSGSGET